MLVCHRSIESLYGAHAIHRARTHPTGMPTIAPCSRADTGQLGPPTEKAVTKLVHPSPVRTDSGDLLDLCVELRRFNIDMFCVFLCWLQVHSRVKTNR